MDPHLLKKSAQKYSASVGVVLDMASMLDRDTVQRLIRCTEQTAQVDGLPQRTTPDPEDPPRKEPVHATTCPQLDGSNDCECGAVVLSDGTSRPTEDAAVRLTTGRPVPDPVRESALEALAIITEMAGLAIALRSKITSVTHAGDKLKGRKSVAGNCGRCGGTVTGVDPDRIKSHMGPTCYNRWVYLGKPDRAEFVRTIEDDEPRCGALIDEPVTKMLVSA